MNRQRNIAYGIMSAIGDLMWELRIIAEDPTFTDHEFATLAELERSWYDFKVRFRDATE